VVVDEVTGAPVAGASVVVVEPFVALIASAITDADGSYLINGIRSGSWVVGVIAPGMHGEFFDNVPDILDATPIAFGSGDELVLNVALTPIGEGLLRVVTDPPVPAVLIVDGEPRDMWGLTWMPITEGDHTVCFGEVTGFVAPPCEDVVVSPNETTEVTGHYTPVAMLRVLTDPPLPSTVSVDGHPANDWGVWTALPVGPHEVCFGKVAGWTPPSCEVVELIAGETITLTGQFTEDVAATGPDTPFGFLRVSTSPAVPGRISVDGFPADSWGLNWVKVSPGEHTVCFSDDVVGFRAPACGVVDVPEGATGELVGTYVPWGSLRILTDPALPAVVFVDGISANAWGVWTSATSAPHQVCFGPVIGFTTPECQDVTVEDGVTTTVTGTYLPIE
jgi:hypothetical protein